MLADMCLSSYDHIDAEKQMGETNGKQAGDPAKGARAMWEIASIEDPPLRTAIGSDAYTLMMGKLETYGMLLP